MMGRKAEIVLNSASLGHDKNPNYLFSYKNAVQLFNPLLIIKPNCAYNFFCHLTLLQTSSIIFIRLVVIQITGGWATNNFTFPRT